MSDFKAKMHQIKFRLGRRSLQRSSDLLDRFKGTTSKGRDGSGGKEKEGEERGGEGKVGRRGKGGT